MAVIDADEAEQGKADQVFTPFHMVRLNLKEHSPERYKVYARNGSCVTVDAATAAEAARLSGVANPQRIVNIMHERSFSLTKEALELSNDFIATNIDVLSQEIQEFIRVDDLDEQKGADFIALEINQLAVPKIAPVFEEIPVAASVAPPPETEMPVTEAAPVETVEEVPSTPVVEEDVARELSPDDVRRLLQEEESKP